MSDYELVDSGEFEKLERFGDFYISRPAPGAIWKKSKTKEWKLSQARFERYALGKGEWLDVSKDLPSQWDIEFSGFKMVIQRTAFGHLGIFPEQMDNWTRFTELCQKLENPKVLNLFAYTGGATLACARGGAEIVHVDASKSSIESAKLNAEKSGFSESTIRYMVDDVMAFVSREIRRGNRYDAIILDPPTFGRGTKAQVWKIEDRLIPLLDHLKELCSENFSFISLSAHSPFYSPICLENLLMDFIGDRKGKFVTEEMILKGGGLPLPSGSTCLFTCD
ncbi:MAG: class I SAM-dependent methyltransferase [Bdellovibrionales bacterium]|nr:class I SAM-dependent methyltransferase [Bdellovibrionales bacterium]